MSKPSVVVPDLHTGNMASVANMVRKHGGDAEIISDYFRFSYSTASKIAYLRD